SLARLVEENGSVVGGDNAAARPVSDMFRNHDLTLIGLDARKLRQQIAREGIRRDDEAPGDDRASLGDDVMLVLAKRVDTPHSGAGIESDPIAQRAAQLPAHVFERVVGAVARDETAEKVGLYAELFGNLSARPNRDSLSMLRGERDLVADPLLLARVGGDVQPAFRGKIAGNSFPQYGVLEQIAVAQRQAEHQRGLPLAERLQNLDR